MRKYIFLFLMIFSVFLSFFSYYALINTYHETKYTLMIKNYCPHFGIYYSKCSGILKTYYLALSMYASEHDGCLPPASAPDDYYYWVKGVKPYLSNKEIYCPEDTDRKAPSSYISDPRLAGKKLEDLEKIPDLIVLRERDYRHPGKKAAFIINGFAENLSKDEIPKDAKYYPDLPERENVTYQLFYSFFACVFWTKVFFICLIGNFIFYFLWRLAAAKDKKRKKEEAQNNR